MNIAASIEISSSPNDIFVWVDNWDKTIYWQKGVKNIEILENTLEKVGTTFKEELEENGKSLTIYGEIVDHLPDELISLQLESKIHSVLVMYFVDGNSDKSTFSVDSTIRWKFPMNLTRLIIGHKIKRNILLQTKSELLELKKLCENDANNLQNRKSE